MMLSTSARLRRIATLLSLAAIFGATSCRSSAPSPARPLRVAAAISLSEVMNDAAHRWEAAGNEHVELNLAASNVLARQILEGAPVDVFISADEAQMDHVVSGGRADPATRVTLFTNQLVVITPAGRSLPGAPPASLGDAEVRRLAIGDPQGVPAGVYARRWLERTGLWPRVEKKIVPSGSVRAALAAVEAGNADAGIVYRTDARHDDKVSIAYEVPLADAPPIVYPGAIVTRATHPDAARRFIAFLQTAACRQAFSAAGFMDPDRAMAR